MERFCWDFFECRKEDMEKCPAYVENCGAHCWLVAASSTDIINSGGGANGVKHCFNCDFFISRHEIL